MIVEISVRCTGPFLYALCSNVRDLVRAGHEFIEARMIYRNDIVNFYMIYWGLQCTFSLPEGSGSYVPCNDVPMT
jgi:hypothetical protein